jgi:hypothetical protein
MPIQIQHPTSKYTAISSVMVKDALDAFVLELLAAYKALPGSGTAEHSNVVAHITWYVQCYLYTTC